MNHPYNFPPSPDSIAGDLTEKRFRIKVESGTMNFRCLEHGADEITFKREDGEGFVEMDLLEFLDQYSLGRIQLIESLGFQEESAPQFSNVSVWRTNKQGWAISPAGLDGAQVHAAIEFRDTKGEATKRAREIAQANGLEFFNLSNADDTKTRKVYLRAIKQEESN